MKSSIDISIVIPVFNSARILPKLIHELRIFVQQRKEQFEVLLVDDFSTDDSWLVLKELCLQNRGLLKAIRLSRNCGQQSATLCGMRECKGDIIITMDDDLQHKPKDIEKLLLTKQDTGAAIVIARLVEKRHGLFRKMCSDAMKFLSEKLVSKPKNLYLSSFRLMGRDIADNILKIQTYYPYFPVLMLTVTRNIVNVDITHSERFEGKSNYSFFKSLTMSTRLIINNSSILLDCVGLLGLVSSLLSFGVAILILIKKMVLGIPIQGWTSLIISVYLVGGLILFSTGIIGKYLLRILNETLHRPNYFISEKIDFSGEKLS